MSDNSSPQKGDSEWKAGDVPPDGYYSCLTCGGTNPYVAIVPEIHRKLPVCPICGGRNWYKI